MATKRTMRRWMVGLSFTMAPLLGCANGPATVSKNFFPWFRSTPMTDLERQRQERETAQKKLDDPTDLHVKYGQWREQVGDLSDARKSYQVALKENPKSLEAKLGLARLDQLAGRSADAERGFQNALNSRPGSPLALGALGQFYASEKRWNKAIPLLEQAAEAAPGELAFRHRLAVALAQSGDIEAAFNQFRQTVGDAEAHYNVGYLLHEQGHKDAAIARFQKALMLNPELEQAQVILDELQPKDDSAVAIVPGPPQQRQAKPRIQRYPENIEQTQFAEAASPLPVRNPPAWVTTRETTRPMPAAEPAPQPNPMPTPPPAYQAPAPQKEVTPPASNFSPAPEPPAFRPTWKRHQELPKAPTDAPEYLPPYRPDRGDDTASGASAAQLEQRANQQ